MSALRTPKRIAAFRREFPALRGHIYFNHGAATVTPSSVVRAAVEGVRLDGRISIDGPARSRCQETREETRRAAAELVGAAPENLAFVASTSVALSMVALAIPWRKGDNVVTGVVENPATVVPWQNLAHLGVEVRYLPAHEDDRVELDDLPGLIDDRTRLVALSLVQYSTGQRLDLARVSRLCRPRGIWVSADGVQAVGAVPVDVRELGVNFLSFATHKWLLGPRHIGALYVDPEILPLLRSPVVTENNSVDIRGEEEEPTRCAPQLRLETDARKLEARPYNNHAGAFGFHRALLNLRANGGPAAFRRLRAVGDRLVEGLSALDGRVVSPRGDAEWSGLVSFALRRADPREVAAGLARRGIHIAVRKGRLRIAPHYYNTEDEIQRFLAALKEEMNAHVRPS